MTRNWCRSTRTPLPPTTKRTNTNSSAWRSKYADLRGKEVRARLGRTEALSAMKKKLSEQVGDKAPKMRKEFRSKLSGDESRENGTASFTLPFDTREVWGKAKVPVKVTINGYTWRSTVGNRDGIQYLVVNAAARRHAGVKAGDFVTIMLEPDTEKRQIEVPIPLQKALGAKLTQKLNALSFTHKKEFIVWYSEAKKDDTRARRVEKMKQMLSVGEVIS
jgi:bifunctional DNA-binding transcriptional regulator/antitoxin component of YhaV-PrlF toxin-antitoxin module